MSTFRFTKMTAIGNDYVYVDADRHELQDPGAIAHLICDRHRGIGGDGLILVGSRDVDDADVEMRIFNRDGGEAEMCGNGIRCVARFAIEQGMVEGPVVTVRIGARVLEVTTIATDGVIDRASVAMGSPGTLLRDVAASIPGLHGDEPGIGLHFDFDLLLEDEGPTLRIAGVEPICSLVSMGNPHLVFWTDRPDQIPLEQVGPRLEHHAWFPDRINVHFVRVDAPDRITMRTWERGSGATLACGSGACAVCVAGVLEGRTNASISARLPGGILELAYDRDSGNVTMAGPMLRVFTGEIDPETIELEPHQEPLWHD
ncbi:MAG: diaminopimelate epimerase [Planctomycetota bacterium]|nr:diaminopimelate epimerase [Planctomycetota bacterium]